MVVNQRLIFLVVIKIVFLNLLNLSAAQECPFSPCADVQPLASTDILEIGVYFDILYYRNTPFDNLSEIICRALEEFEGNVTAVFKPGAAVTVAEDGWAGCGDFCNNDRIEACKCKLDPIYQTTCASPNVEVQAYNVCLATNGGDQLLIANGQEREALGIPMCRLPALTFNGVFDPCGVFSTYEELFLYICNLFDNSLYCCSF